MANKVGLFRRSNGSVAVTRINWSFMKPDETEDEFVNRVKSKIFLGNPDLATQDFYLVDEDTLPDKQKQDKWRMDDIGNITIDESAKTNDEKVKDKILAVENELKALGLSKDAVDTLLGK